MHDPQNFLSASTLPTISFDGKPLTKREQEKLIPLTVRLSDVEAILNAARRLIETLQNELAAIEGFGFSKRYVRRAR